MRSPKLDQEHFYPFFTVPIQQCGRVSFGRRRWLTTTLCSSAACKTTYLRWRCSVQSRTVIKACSTSLREPLSNALRLLAEMPVFAHCVLVKSTGQSASRRVVPASLPPSFCFPAESGVDRQSARYATLRGTGRGEAREGEGE